MPHRLTLLPDQPQQLGELTLTALEIVEKRLEDGRPMMRVRVRANRDGDQRLLVFTSDAPLLDWAGLRFRYAGGWRSEVWLDITPVPD